MLLLAGLTLALWLLVVALWFAASRLFRRSGAEKLRQRILGQADKKRPAGEPAVLLETTQQAQTGRMVLTLLRKYNLTERLQALLEQAGLRWHVARFVHASMAGFLAGYGAFWALAPTDFQQLALLAGAAGAALPLLYVLRLRRRRLKAFEALFPDCLEFISRSMRAGHAFSVSLEMICREFQEPLAGEFKRTFEEHNLGLPLDAALQKLARRVPLLDVHFFVSAVMLQKRTGGNLAEILDKLAYVIRERFKLRGRIQAVSAHGRMTGLALSLIPAAVAVMMFYINPEYAKFFFTDALGRIMLGIAIGLQLIGYLIIKKIVAIEI